MTNYLLVNPHIEGDFDKTYQGNTPVDAAYNVWDALRPHLTNLVPKFAYTMEREIVIKSSFILQLKKNLMMVLVKLNTVFHK